MHPKKRKFSQENLAEGEKDNSHKSLQECSLSEAEHILAKQTERTKQFKEHIMTIDMVNKRREVHGCLEETL